MGDKNYGFKKIGENNYVWKQWWMNKKKVINNIGQN